MQSSKPIKFIDSKRGGGHEALDNHHKNNHGDVEGTVEAVTARGMRLLDGGIIGQQTSMVLASSAGRTKGLAGEKGDCIMARFGMGNQRSSFAL